MFGKLEEIEVKYDELEQELAQPDIFNDQERYKKVSKAHSDLGAIVKVFREYKKSSQELEDNREMLGDADPDIQEMAKMEIDDIESRLPGLEEQLKVLLLPKIPWMKRILFLRFELVQAAMRPRCLLQICSVCIPVMRRIISGKSRK